ncbi:ArsC/Spx/MgsR family protein [Leptolyngbya ohadii]|uniref:ArsC/Spx/MgsR family protein n=1 Tax=Leptolyngbya ohadii TaxID=1962290 RepID=UPI000B5A0FE5|nr:ArsC/Spx/MgsR family protein [Leptolyngbya ohadii]
MATVIFYEKPGCINNTKQKALLKAAGHSIDARNLLTESWTVERLEAFFRQRPIAEWFNSSAPLIKSGEVVPSQLDRSTAIQLMIQNPLLIRRPLIQSGDRYTVGFDVDEIESWLGLTPVQENQQTFCDELKQQDLQNCPRSTHAVSAAFT